MSLGEKYCVFSTKWGYFGISTSDGKITRTCLPSSDPELVEHEIKLGRPDGVYDSRLLPEVQQQIRLYFEGKQCPFKQFALDVSGIGGFAQDVYSTLRQVCQGDTVSYGQLAVLAGRPGAARAVGRIMANNPYPLLVPCHRVVSASGKLGGFSGIGGVDMKKRLLTHEKAGF